MWIWAVGAIVLLVAILSLHRRYYLLQYLFFLRYPLLLAVVMAVVLPATAWGFGGPFRNLFVLERPSALALVTMLALIVAWQVMYCAGLLYEHTPRRVALPFVRPSDEQAESDWKNPVPRVLASRVARFGLFALLALPVIGTTVWFSLAGAPQHPGSGQAAMTPGGTAVGLALGLALALFIVAVLGWLGPKRGLSSVSDGVVWLTAWIDRVLFGKTTIATEAGVRRERARSFVFKTEVVFLFAVVTIAVYLVLGLLAPIDGDRLGRFDLPSMLYVLLLMMVLAWILCWLSFLLDRHRLLPELVLVPLVAILYGVFGTDHFFTLRELPAGWAGEGCPSARPSAADPSGGTLLTTPPAEQLAGRQRWAGANDRPVVVAASGGGITAAYWTSVVLSELERALAFEGGAGFSDRVALVSGTSGGSVAALYYVDAFEAKSARPRAFRDDELERLREAAGASSLNAVGWGFVYRDFWRAAFPPLVTREDDRAVAMETRWRQGLLPNRRRWDAPNPPQPSEVHDPSFGDWAVGVRAGWRPAAVFNAVLVESGELLQIANVALPGDARRRELEFSDLFPGADVGAVTAARLSATFPWVTPTARPDLAADCPEQYHVADGGYYDNFGVLSALAWARALPRDARPVLVEIRSSDSRARGEPELDGGFMLATIGPLQALLSVRTTGQLGRNEELVRQAGLTRVVFELRQPAPLSWHLSAREREEIAAGWRADHVQQQLRELCRQLGATCRSS